LIAQLVGYGGRQRLAGDAGIRCAFKIHVRQPQAPRMKYTAECIQKGNERVSIFF
jgi:hypothetical protein